MIKKFASILLILLISHSQCFAQAENDSDAVKLAKHSGLSKISPIEDELVKSDLFPKIMPMYIKQTEPIEDELISPYKKEGSTLKIWTRKDAKQEIGIDDELITSGFKSKFGGIGKFKKTRQAEIDDYLAKNIELKNVRKIKIKNKYDFTKRQIPIHLKIVSNLSTKHKIKEGDSIVFETTNDVVINDEYLPEGTRIIGRVEIISNSDKMGTPANIIIDNFYVENRPDICLYGNVSKTGANRSLWVYPLYQAGNIMFYVAGFVFVPIHGGHAKVSTSDKFTLYYETN